MTRRGARSIATVPPAHLAALNAGTAEAATLSESLAMDLAALWRACFPGLPAPDLPASLGITRRVALAGQALHAALAPEAVAALANHPSDMVRGWAAHALAAAPGLDVAGHAARLRPFAADAHFGVREWAWMALRPHIAADLPGALAALRPWTAEASPFLRRFAVEATRPRGVWCAHLPELRRNPAAGLVLLEPLRADPARYVQDSVANWINDAAKDQPAWAHALLARWAEVGAAAHILRRAARSLRAG